MEPTDTRKQIIDQTHKQRLILINLHRYRENLISVAEIR